MGQFFLNQPKARNALSELLAVMGVCNRQFNGITSWTNGHRRQLEPADVERVKRHMVPFSGFIEKVFERDLCIIEGDSGGRRPLEPHLIFLSFDGQTGCVTFDQKCRKLFAVDLGHDEEKVGPFGIADPHFGAVQNPFPVPLNRSCRHAQGVGARVWLAECVGTH